MSKLYVDVLGFNEIGGVGEMIYHTVKFSDYEIVKDQGEQCLKPVYTPDYKPIPKTDFSLTGQQLLVELCNLYRKINDPSNEESYVQLIIDWCKTVTHPYNIDSLFEQMSEPGFDASDLANYELVFSVNDFVHSLADLYNTYAFHYALQRLENNDERYAFNLYHEGRFYDGYPFFEKYKRQALSIDESASIREYTGPEDLIKEMQADSLAYAASETDVQSGHFLHNPLNDYGRLRRTLLELFPEFCMKLKVNPKNQRVVYAADVQSVFDIAWYAFSRDVADDSTPKDTDLYYENPQGCILACLACGAFFIRRSNRQLYCDNPNCQAERKRKNRRDCDTRKRIEKSTK